MLGVLTMKLILVAGGLFVLFFLPSVVAQEKPAEDAKLAAFFDKFLEAEFRRHPYDATKAGDHRFDDRLDDLSPAARAADLHAAKTALADLPQKVECAKLT